MNIFYIDKNPQHAAQQLADDHIRKMQIESAQMCSVAHWVTGSTAPYKQSHTNHPSTKWTCESLDHAQWLLDHGLEICDEFVVRYGKEHATRKVLFWVKDNLPLISDKFPSIGFVPPPQCMPDEYKTDDTIKAYRDFYIKDKLGIKKLNYNKLNNTPKWINESL